MTPELIAAYRAARRRSFPPGLLNSNRTPGFHAWESIAWARADFERYASEGRYLPSFLHKGPQHGQADERGLRWIEGAASIMRRVGFADEVAETCDSRSIDHQGWWTHDEGLGESFVGVVYRLTGGRGFLAGYEHCETTRRRQRSNMSDGARLDCSHVWACPLDAAKEADRIAERESAIERDYQAASSAGFYCGELLQEIKQTRTQALALALERRAAMRDAKAGEFPTICEALRQAELTARRHILKLRDKIAKAREESEWRQPEAFAESFGEGA